MKFIKLFWKHKFSWKMWVRLVFSPLMLLLVLTEGWCDASFKYLNRTLPKIDKET